MSAKRKRSVNSSPRDEAPEITKEWVAGAELRRGTKLRSTRTTSDAES